MNAIVLDADEEEAALVSKDTYESIPPPGSASESSFATPSAAEGAAVRDTVLHQSLAVRQLQKRRRGDGLGQSVVSTSVHHRVPTQAVGSSTEVDIDAQTSDYIVLEVEKEGCIEGKNAVEFFERSVGLVSKDGHVSVPPRGSASESSIATHGAAEGMAVRDAVLRQPLAALRATSSGIGSQSLSSASAGGGSTPARLATTLAASSAAAAPPPSAPTVEKKRRP